jgi:hypothetical protein
LKAATPAQETEYKGEASGTVGEGSHDQEATQRPPQDAVRLLRQQEHEALGATDDIALGAIYGIDRHLVEKIQSAQPPSKWIHIFGNVQAEKGIDQFAPATGY